MGNKRINHAVADPYGKAKRTPGILAKLFWGLVARSTVCNSAGKGDFTEWNWRFRKYVGDPKNVPEQTAARRSEARNNLASALMSDNPTFMQVLRGIIMLGNKKMRITIEAWDENNDYSYATVVSRLDEESIIAELLLEEDEDGKVTSSASDDVPSGAGEDSAGN